MEEKEKLEKRERLEIGINEIEELIEVYLEEVKTMYTCILDMFANILQIEPIDTKTKKYIILHMGETALSSIRLIRNLINEKERYKKQLEDEK